jgi:hypothetical protein
MDRIGRDTGVLPDSLADAADELQVSIERYVRELVGAAQARASEISEQAARKAPDVGAGPAAAAGASRMLDAIDLIESRTAESFASLISEARELLAQLEKVQPTARSGDYPDDEGWIDELDEAMAELLMLDELPEQS